MSHKTLCGAVQSKFWGHTQCIFIGPISETHYLNINEGGFCSEHCHLHKWNRFFLIKGSLKIIIYRDGGQDETILKPGNFTDVPPGDFHKFEALEDCECLEIYWVDQLETDDIKRRSVGGVLVSEMELMGKSVSESLPERYKHRETFDENIRHSSS